MKSNFEVFKFRQFAWHAIIIAFLYLTLAFTAFDIYAKDIDSLSPVPPLSMHKSVNQLLQQKVSGKLVDCGDDEACEEILALCEDRQYCLTLFRICQQEPDICDDVVEEARCEMEGECEDFRECDEDDEECDAFRECEEDDEECDAFRECEEDDEECDAFRECEEDDEECDAFRECEEDDEECDAFRECEEDDEECDAFRECEEDDEECDAFRECDEDEEECDAFRECEEDEQECQELPECDTQEEECEEFPECDSQEEACEEFHQNVSTGYENPNPLPDSTEMVVEQSAANNASRFLAQATLGADYATISQVASFGEDMWLESQFQQPPGYLFPYIDHLFKRQEELDEQYPDSDLLGGPLSFHMHAWWTQVMTSPDLVRQRIAMALSEIFVVSSNVEIIGESPYMVSQYYDTLIKHSFGNFRDLLKDISLNPAMAIYLSHLNNEKADPSRGTYPDENYARGSDATF